jgi:hypothetical protein
MTKAQDFSPYLLRHVDEHGEYFTVKSTGQSGMSHRGLGRFIGKNHSIVTRWVQKVRDADPVLNNLPNCLKPFAGKNLTLVQYDDPTGRDILNDSFCGAMVKLFASEVPKRLQTSKAQAAEQLINSVGMRQIIHLKTGWKPQQVFEDFEVVHRLHKQRMVTRLALKDVFRVELMDAIKAWRQRHNASRKVFWEAQDAVNTRIQGLKSQEIKVSNGLSKSSYIRDYFDAEPLIDYSAINRLASNLIEGKDVHPVDAVNQACDLYLKPGFHPAPLPILENVHHADRRLREFNKRKKLKASQHQQLSLGLG